MHHAPDMDEPVKRVVTTRVVSDRKGGCRTLSRPLTKVNLPSSYRSLEGPDYAEARSLGESETRTVSGAKLESTTHLGATKEKRDTE